MALRESRESIFKPRRWSSGLAASCLRFLLVHPILHILIRAFTPVLAENVDVFRGLNGPVILAANHQSDLDTLVLLAALPEPWRYRVVPTIAEACFVRNMPPLRPLKSLQYAMLVLFLNGLTLPRGPDLRGCLRHMAWLVQKKWSILIYPEGEISSSNQLLPFEAGVGFIAKRLNLPVVPVRIDGTGRVWNRSSKCIRPGPVRLRFGAPLWLKNDNYRELSRQVEQAIHSLSD